MRCSICLVSLGLFALGSVLANSVEACQQSPQVEFQVPESVAHYLAEQVPQSTEMDAYSHAEAESLPNSDCPAPGQTLFATQGVVSFDTCYTYPMLDFQNRQGDKEVLLLDHALKLPDSPTFTLGAQFRASGLFASTNTDDSFPYLGRFPTDFAGNSASDFRMLHANQNVTVHLNSAVHGYFETLFSDVFSFAAANQGSYQVRQAYAVFGDFSRSPWYAFIGKKNISFGDLGTLSPFTQAVPWHYFAPLAEGAGLGYNSSNLTATVTALNGSRGIRVVDSEEKGHLNNFAANVLFKMPVGSGGRLDLGAGYLNGTIYNAAVAEHLDPSLFGPDNAAWDVNAKLRMGRLQLAGEYIQTVDPWPATGHEVIAYRTEAAVDTYWMGYPARGSVSWSEGIQGPPGTEFEFNRQLVLGYSVQPFRNAFFTIRIRSQHRVCATDQYHDRQ